MATIILLGITANQMTKSNWLLTYRLLGQYVTALLILYTGNPVVMYPIYHSRWALDVFLSDVEMSDSEYSQLHAAMEKLNTEAAKMAENQKSLLSHNAQVVQLVEDFRTVQQNLKKTTSGKPSASS